MHGHLSVASDPPRIVGEHGGAVRLRGMSLFWSQWGGHYWNRDVVHWLHQDWGVSLLRAAMGVEAGGYLENSHTEKNKLRKVVDAAVEAGIYVIIDWHDHAAQNHRSEAKEFFEEMSRTYGSLPNVLFETFNEPLQQSWSQDIKPYHEEIVKVIRSHSQNIIICGTPTWSQDVDSASQDKIAVENVAYTLHFYAGTHTQYLRDKAEVALSQGAALFVSEWGTCEADGNGRLDFQETERWLSFLEEHSISDACWAVNDKNEACSALVPGASTSGGWRDSELTESGRWVRESIRSHSLMAQRRASGVEDTGEVSMHASQAPENSLHFAVVGFMLLLGHLNSQPSRQAF